MDEVKQRRSVLILSDFLFPEYLGGSSRFASELNDALVDAGFDVTCITRKPKGQYSSSFTDKRSYRVFLVKDVKEFYSVIFSADWDVLIAHHFLLGMLSYLVSAKKKIYFFHGPVHLERISRGGSWLSAQCRRFLEFLVLKHVGNIFCLSQYMKNYLPQSLRYKASITGPLFNKQMPDTIRPRMTKNDRLKLLTVRRLTGRTGVSELVDLVEKIDQDVELTVVGTGELLPILKSNRKKNVKVLGEVSEDKLHQLYEDADLFVLPSRELEGFGLVIIESILRGTPVLASNCAGGGADFLKSFSVDFLYQLDGSPQEFLKCVKKATSAFCNEKIRNEIHMRIKQYSMAKFIEKELGS